MDNQQEFRQEIQQIREELKVALKEIKSKIGNNLSSQEMGEVENEFQQLDELLERLETGLVWLCFFGKTSVGKSAIANSLIGEDLAKVGIQHDLTTEPAYYEKRPWMLVDVPGILGKEVNKDVAIEEAEKAHGHIFVLDGEPLELELELFNLVHNKMPTTPKIVFVNQWDKMQSRPKKDRETVRERIEQKMGKFIKSPDDIVYGSAQIYDPDKDDMVRQEIPKLLDKLYEDAGALGEVVNILDPASRADDITQGIRDRILTIRKKIARRVINVFGIASAAVGLVPFDQLVVTPGVLTSMVLVITLIMGRNANFMNIEGQSSNNVTKAGKMAIELLKACGEVLFWEFVAVFAGGLALDVVGTIFGPLGMGLTALADLAALGWYRYNRTAILGEVTIEYVSNGFSWGADGAEAVIKRCKERAQEHYVRLQSKK
ncbi:GTPase [Okeania sp. KiyG1]|uniref:GTPase n=1 Tax=Okeania sp. KiyG1 TaxID=2720165 RepID=UPI0019240958|nr:GTPase [Okeania sp. KiyG1]GGA12166.1 hypothetical protein CYANOKiyG1_25310 [Okeania sp. KiyG1]